MLFLNSGARSRIYTHKVGHSCIICEFFSIVTGLILIIIGVTSEINKTTFISIGIITLGAGCLLATFVYFYRKLGICYNNLANRSRIMPINIEKLQPAPPCVVSISALVASSAISQKRQSTIPIETTAPITVASDVEIYKFVITPSIKIDATKNNSDNVT